VHSKTGIIWLAAGWFFPLEKAERSTKFGKNELFTKHPEKSIKNCHYLKRMINLLIGIRQEKFSVFEEERA
jgi:hypothetical protein